MWRTHRLHRPRTRGSPRRPAKQPISLGGPAVAIWGLRAIKPSPRAIAECSIDREKFLRIGVSMGMRTVRSMRAVFCWTLLQEIILRTAPDLLTSTIAPLSLLKDLPSRRMGPRRPRGLTI